MKIGIVGMGVAGISLIREIKNQMNQRELEQTEIVIFSDKELFGTGLPFQEDDSALLLNQYTESMTINPDYPKDFLHWVEKNKTHADMSHKHVPRAWFGNYLKERLNGWLKELPVTIIYQKVNRITPTDHQTYVIETRDYTEEVAFVHLAIGHLAYQDPFKLIGKTGYIYHPYPAIKQLSFKKENLTIGILGSRLTAIDAMRFIQKKNPTATFHFFSLDGIFSSIRGHFPNTLLNTIQKNEYVNALLNSKKELTLEQVKDWFVKIGNDNQVNIKWIWRNLGSGDIAGLEKDLNYLEELGRFQKLISEMKDTFPHIWEALSDKEKEYYKKHFETPFLNFKIPIPQQVSRELLALFEEGRAFMHSYIESINDNENGFLVKCREEKPIQVDYLVNATGQRTHLSSHLDYQQPLIKQLIEDKVLTPYKHGGGNIAYPSMSVIAETGEVNSQFKVYGQLASGIQYGNTNIDLVSQSASEGIKDMLQTLKKSQLLDM